MLLDAVVHFQNLDKSIVRKIVEKFIVELNVQLKKKKVEIQVSSEAQDWLVEKGYDRAYGARPMARTIDEYIKKPLVDEILFGKLSKSGGTARFDRKAKAPGLNFEIIESQS